MSLFPQVVFFCFEVVAVSFVILVNGPMKLLQKRSTICQIDYFKAEYCHHQTGGFNCRRCHRNLAGLRMQGKPVALKKLRCPDRLSATPSFAMMSLNSTASSPSLILAQTSDSWKAVVDEDMDHVFR